MSVFVTNLDDFINPSQACIVTTSNTNSTTITNLSTGTGTARYSSTNNSKITTVSLDLSITEFDQTISVSKPSIITSKPSTGKQPSSTATVSLSDCLACSGCVTTAETILIQEQSYAKLLNKLQQNDAIVAVSLSPQSYTSIAIQLGISPSEAFLKIAYFLKSIGVTYVLDTTSAGDVSLVVSREEFILRHRNGRSKSWVRPPTSVASSSTASWIYPDTNINITTASSPPEIQPTSPLDPTSLSTPMLASHCPGWICYAEKNQPEALPYISTTKSAQQILGSLLKFVFGDHQRTYKTGSNIPLYNKPFYHVSVQPCFDKKLEASRKDFYHENSRLQQQPQQSQYEVDLVLSTQELYDMITQQITLSGIDTTVSEYMLYCPLDEQLGCDVIERLFRSFSQHGYDLVYSVEQMGGSGGWSEYIAKYAAEQILGLDLWHTQLQYKEGRSSDMLTLTLETPPEATETDGIKAVLKFGLAYGFQNIQSIILKLKRGQCDLDFVEVMACPSGCINGGGQLKTHEKQTVAESKQRIAEFSHIFHSHKCEKPDDSLLVRFLVEEMLFDTQSPLFHTLYHAVPKLEVIAPTVIKW